MLHKNKNYTAKIVGLQPQGNGLATVHGKTIIIPGALPGDEVSFKVIKLTKTYAVGKLVTSFKKSDHHTDPTCPILKNCGGCHLQHMTYNAQLKHKMDLVKKCLHKITSSIQDIIPAVNPFFYRNKAQFAFQKTQDGNIAVGLFSIMSHRVADTKKCAIQHPLINETLQQLRTWIYKNPSLTVYDEVTGEGELRHVVIRVGVNTKEVMLALVVGYLDASHEKSFIENFKNIPNIKSLLVNINRAPGNTILGGETQVLYGGKTIADQCCNVNYDIGISTFAQSDPLMAEHLYQYVAKMVLENNPKVVLDLYCGLGVMTLHISKYADEIIGVELSEESIKNATKIAETNGVKNVTYFQGDVKEVLPTLKTLPDLVVLDPPRKGCDTEVLEYLAKNKIKTLIYVSCNPQTLGRDLEVLVSKNYAVISVQPFDNFAQTAHVECVVVLRYTQLNVADFDA